MVGLIDLDSLLYTAVYRIVSFKQIREALAKYGKEGARQWLYEEVYNEGINRCENQMLQIQNHLENIFFDEIKSFEVFITTCTNSFRKEIYPEYKAQRKRNNYVWLLREHYRNNGAHHSDILEADDLMAERAKELGIGNFITISIDKDLKQLGGYYWSYYKTRSKDMQGNFIENEYGDFEKEYKQKTVDFISKDMADLLFWEQMLMGDASDNIKGINGIGPVKASKLLSEANNRFICVAREYLKRDQKNDFWMTFKLLKLGNIK